MPLTHILKNKLLLQKHFNTQEGAMDRWPYWLLEENIKLVNEIIDEEEKNKKKEEEKQQANMPNFNPGSMMKDATSMTNKFKT
jgi:hypothetical protein